MVSDLMTKPVWQVLRDGHVTPASDVYSFAILMYEMYTRKHLFKGMMHSQARLFRDSPGTASSVIVMGSCISVFRYFEYWCDVWHFASFQWLGKITIITIVPYDRSTHLLTSSAIRQGGKLTCCLRALHPQRADVAATQSQLHTTPFIRPTQLGVRDVCIPQLTGRCPLRADVLQGVQRLQAADTARHAQGVPGSDDRRLVAQPVREALLPLHCEGPAAAHTRGVPSSLALAIVTGKRLLEMGSCPPFWNVLKKV